MKHEEIIAQSISKVEECINAHLISFIDIEHYCNSLGLELVNRERLELLEEKLANHPG